jgi:hypothetical protein
MNGKPFALIGVNSDDDAQKLKADLKENEVTWRSFHNRRQGRPDIAAEWNVKNWPTLYLIDHKGTIRKKWRGRPEFALLENEIDGLVQAALDRK